MVKAVVGDREFHKKLLSLVLPIALQQLMLAAVSASDAVMLNFVSQDKMSAVSLAAQITFVENLFLAAMTIGQSMLAAQYWGKKDVAAVEKVFAYVMKITVMVAWFFFLAALCVPSFLMRLLTNEPVLIAEGATYLRIVSPSYLLAGVSQVYLCALKNSGKARQAGVISAVCMAGDMLMNAALIAGLWGFPRLEIAGAANFHDRRPNRRSPVVHGGNRPEKQRQAAPEIHAAYRPSARRQFLEAYRARPGQ